MSESGLSEDWKPRVREDLVFRSVAGEWVIYDPRSRDLHVLNVTAAAVWTRCDGRTTPATIARELVEELEGGPDPEVVLGDVTTALVQLRAAGLVE